MSRIYKCDFCGKICEDPNEVYQLESVPCDTVIFDVDRFIGKHVCQDCLKSINSSVIRVVPGK